MFSPTGFSRERARLFNLAPVGRWSVKGSKPIVDLYTHRPQMKCGPLGGSRVSAEQRAMRQPRHDSRVEAARRQVTPDPE